MKIKSSGALLRSAIAYGAVVTVMGVQPAISAEGTASSTVSNVSISSQEALRIARIALDEGKRLKSDVAVVVAGQSGLPLVMLRSDRATEQFVTGATRKAWTSINFRASTAELFKLIKAGHGDDSQLVMAKNALFLAGGEPIKKDGVVVGAVGIAGFVEGSDDARVAKLVADSFEKERQAPAAEAESKGE